MPKKSEVWKYFTRLTDENGNKIGKATCNKCADILSKNKCADNKKFNTKGGTSNKWRHFLKHFTYDEEGTMHCNKCQSKLEGDIASRVEHVVACNNLGAGAEGASRQPPVQTRAPPPGAVSSPMYLGPADLGSQPPLLPSAPSRPGGPDMEQAKYHLAKMITLRGYDPSIIDDDCFRSFVKCLDPKFKVPSRDDIEAVCKDIIWEAMKDDAVDGRISLAVGKARVIETEVIYLAYHFIDSEWNLHQKIRSAAISSVWSETPADIGLNMVSTMADEYRQRYSWQTSVHGEHHGRHLFTVAWGVTDDHSKLKDFLNQMYLPHAGAHKRKVFCTTFVDCILHSVADHLYRNIDTEFRGHISKSAPFFDFIKEWQLKVLSRDGLDLWTYKEAWYSWFCYLSIDSDVDTSDLEFRELLLETFEEIYRAIQRICASSGPTANLCLVELIKVRQFLQSKIPRSGGHTNLYEGRSGFADNKDVATVLKELSEILDETIQEWYLVWSIPLVLDPRYRLDGVTSIFREAFVHEADHCVDKLKSNIKELYSAYEDESEGQLYRYMHDPPTEGFDILKWWKVQGSRHYPTVALMARDTLAMPTCNQLSSNQTALLKSMLRGYLRI